MTVPLPLITADLPGIGGHIKAEPDHFQVQEVLLYEPSGEGEHIFVRLTREGWTTRALVERLARLFGLRERDVGYAGLKDKHARVTQTFSLWLPRVEAQEVARLVADALPVQVHEARRHRNKLKPGHLLGNRFRILVIEPSPDALSRAQAIAQALQSRGLPNFYGPQRFGTMGTNAQRGRQVLMGGGPRKRWLRRFLLSAYQSELFNLWLAARIQRGWFTRLLTGDIAKKLDTGGLFEVSDAQVESPRFERREITYTGPIYGAKMRWAGGEAGALEREILSQEGVTEEQLRQARLDGSRRPARLFVDNLHVAPHPQGLLLTFALPKGSYATTLLRELTKTDVRLG